MRGPSQFVLDKAARLAREGAVREFTILVERARLEGGLVDGYAVTRRRPSGEFEVRGDHGTYTVRVKPWIGEVSCSCPWGQHRAAEMFTRPCSHVLAVVRVNLDAEGNLCIEQDPREAAEEAARIQSLVDSGEAFQFY